MEHFGELVQMDGSFHDWLETGHKPCLIDLVDDATAKMGGEFFEQETTEGAMKVLWRWIELYGIPRALYTDHKNLYVADREPTKDEQLLGRPALTAFGKACHKLSIQIIPAASPQAKGRIERRHGVLQDRLVKELRLARYQGPSKRPTRLLAGGFLAAINERFSHSAASRVDYHRPVPKGLRLEDVFVFEEQAHRSERLDGRLGQSLVSDHRPQGSDAAPPREDRGSEEGWMAVGCFFTVVELSSSTRFKQRPPSARRP